MKNTLIFSNTVGDIFSNNADVSFVKKMCNYLKGIDNKNLSLIYIDAPMPNYDFDIVYNNILKCFNKVSTNFEKIYRVTLNSNSASLPKTNVIYFLTGGSPITQYEVIKKHNLINELKETENLVIGFCAGGINLSKFAIITSDDDFPEPISYNGINRVDIVLEPHYNEKIIKKDKEAFAKRKLELSNFAKKLNKEVVALPDSSIIISNGEKIEIQGGFKIFKQHATYWSIDTNKTLDCNFFILII